jgi:recombinational DNA repair protein (RecF pathway)
LVGFLEDLDNSGLNELSWLLREFTLLARLGHGPAFDECVYCGKPLEARTDNMFDPTAGGVGHVRCRPAREATTGLPISPDTLALIRRGLQLDWEARARLRAGPRVIAEMRRILWGYLRTLRGGEINSLRFMEKMGLWS